MDLATEKEGRLNFRPTPENDHLAEFLRQAAVRGEMGLLGGRATGVVGKGIGIRALTNAPHNSACVAGFRTAVLTQGLGEMDVN